MTTKREATIDALDHVPENGKAEIVDGEIVRMSPAGFRHGQAATAIGASLRAYQRRRGGGRGLGTTSASSSISRTANRSATTRLGLRAGPKG